MTSSVVYVHGRFYAAADPRATAMLVRDGRVAWLGETADAPAADAVVDLEQGLVTPAFVDAHVHATDTGLVAGGLDLSGTRSARDVLDAVAAFAAGRAPDAVVHGHGWDESTWPVQTVPTAQELERAAGGRRVYLSQASVHSALVSQAMLAASRGVAAVHECGGPGTSSEQDFLSVLALSGQGLPRVFGYWGELGGAVKAKELGAVGAGGDLYADGALGSRTAWVRHAYEDGPGCGEAFLNAEQVGAHLIECAEVGVQGGFHAIGDAAIAAVLDGFAVAAAALGVDRLRQGRHRIEHVELADKAMIARMVEYGVVASVQPVFDALWGGKDRMYAQRLGVERALATNPIGAMHATGVPLAFGSDSPVTRLEPWAAVAAAVAPANPVFRISARAAFAASTRGGWRAAGVDDAGVLAPGAQASFAVWDTPGGVADGLPALLPDGDGRVPARPVCRRTVLTGETIFEG